MPLRKLHTADTFVYQRSGKSGNVPTVYLPGVHGCWTSLDRARTVLTEHVELVEVAYPLFDSWSLAHYSDALLHLLHELRLDTVHIVAESFGSLIAWQFGLAHPGKVRSTVLVGGFCMPPGMYLAATAGLGLTVLPAFAFDKIVDTYVYYKAAKGESREAFGTKPYPAVRGEKGQKATANRMRLIQETDFREELPRIAFPVRYIGGEKDRIIPVAREVRTLERLLPQSASFDSHLIPGAPHVIIATHPMETATQISQWIGQIEDQP